MENSFGRAKPEYDFPGSARGSNTSAENPRDGNQFTRRGGDPVYATIKPAFLKRISKLNRHTCQ